MLTFRQAKRQFERDYCAQVMEQAGGNVARAAVIADRDRGGFYKVLKRCGYLGPKAERDAQQALFRKGKFRAQYHDRSKPAPAPGHTQDPTTGIIEPAPRKRPSVHSAKRWPERT